MNIDYTLSIRFSGYPAELERLAKLEGANGLLIPEGSRLTDATLVVTRDRAVLDVWFYGLKKDGKMSSRRTNAQYNVTHENWKHHLIPDNYDRMDIERLWPGSKMSTRRLLAGEREIREARK